MKPNFIVIGRTTGECIFIHKDDLDLLIKDQLSYKIKCLAIDFEEKRISKPVIIDVLLKFCPHEEVYSEGERSVINDLILYHFTEMEIIDLNERFERLKYTMNQIERDTEYQS